MLLALPGMGMGNPLVAGTLPESPVQTGAATEPANPLPQTLDTADILRQEIGELQRLLRGDLPANVAVQQLFRVDLADEPAVQRRIEQLESLVVLQPLQTPIQPAGVDDELSATTPPEPEPAIPPEAEPAEPGLQEDTGTPSTVVPAGEPAPAAATASKPQSPGLDITALVQGSVDGLQEAELQALSLRLRLLCLRQPHAVRQQWLERESARQGDQLVAEARQIALERAMQSEQARLRALEEGLRSSSARERTVLDIKAEIEATGHALATYNTGTAQFLADARAASIAVHQFLASSAEEAQAAGAASPRLSDLYGRVFVRLREQRSRVAQRLQLLRNEAEAPLYKGPDPGEVVPELPAETVLELRQALERQQQERSRLEAERIRVHTEQLYVEIADEASINNLANTLLEQLDEDSLDRWTGFGPEGRSLLAAEIERLALEREVILHAGRQFVTDRWAEFRNEASLGPLVGRLLGLIVLVMLYTLGKTRLPVGCAALVRAAFNHQWPLWARRLTWRLNWAGSAFGVDVLRLLAVLLAPAVLDVSRDTGFESVLYQLALAWSLYKFLFAAMQAWLGAGIRTGRVRMDQERSGKLADSLHLIGRYLLVLVVILILSTPILGQGYLYHAIERLGGLGLLALLTLLAYRWQTEVRDWVSKRHADGVLAEFLDRVQAYRWGFVPVTLFALATGTILVVRSSLGLLSGLTAIRRVQAHLLRRKLEKSGRDDAAPTTLPAKLQTILAEQAGDLESRFIVARFQGLEAFRSDLQLWQQERFVGATLVIGRYGYGKTTWLSHAIGGVELPVCRIDLRSRLATSAAVVELMRTRLDVPESVASMEALADWLNRGPRRLIAVDDAQFSFIRDVGGRAGIDALCQLIEVTGRNVYWLVAMANYAYRILAWSSKDNLVFRQVVSLPEWQEEEIRNLIDVRMAAVDWDIQAGDGGDDDPGADAARILKSTHDYLRLIWDYAEGSPAIAIAAWRASLVPGPNRSLRVRLFPQPDAALLESLTEDARFQLAAIVMHEALTVAEVAAVTRLPRWVCEDRCNRLQEDGVLRRIGDHFRVTALWWPVVIRFLRRKHLITARMER